MKRTKTLTTILATAGVTAGCARHVQEQFPILDEHYSHKRITEDFSLFMEPYDTTDEAIFGYHLKTDKSGGLATCLKIDNVSQDKMISFSGEDVTFKDSSGNNWKNVNGQEIHDSFMTSPYMVGLVVTAAIISPVGAGLGALSLSAEKIPEKCEELRLREEQIYPGNSQKGMIYFFSGNQFLSGRDYERTINGGEICVPLTIEGKTEEYMFKLEQPSNWDERR